MREKQWHVRIDVVAGDMTSLKKGLSVALEDVQEKCPGIPEKGASIGYCQLVEFVCPTKSRFLPPCCLKVDRFVAGTLEEVNQELSNRDLDAAAVINVTRHSEWQQEFTSAGGSSKQDTWFEVYYRTKG